MEISIKFASEDTAVLYVQIERNEQLYAAMEQLTEIQKRWVYLYYFRGMKQREIAALEGVNYAAIGSSIRQSLKRLHRILNEQ